MKIVVDCRYKSGVGRYLEGILENFDFDKDEFYLIGKKDELDKITFKFEPIYCDLSPFSFKGLIKYPVSIINKCDVYFTPFFIIPYGIKIPVYSMIHDVVFLDNLDTVNSKIDYMIKKHLLKRCVKKSKKVFTVSEFSKKRIISNLGCKENKILITHSALSKNIIGFNKNYDKENLIVFVGNVKANKGLKTLLEAMNNVNYKLMIIGSKENYRTSDESINKYLDNPNVTFTGYLSDDEMLSCIKKAKFLIQPSTYEGFGLPPLEALYLGTKPIISDIDVFKEIYNDFDVVFFKCGSSSDLAKKINESNYNCKDEREKILNKYNFNKSSNIILNTLKEK